MIYELERGACGFYLIQRMRQGSSRPPVHF